MSTEITKTTEQQAATATAARENWRRPRYEVNPGKEAYELKVYLPGVSKKGAEVTIQGDEMLVSGRRESIRPEGSKIVHEELSLDDYRLKLQLNVDIDADRIEAQTDAGILTVRLPIAEGSKPRAIKVE